MAILLPGLLVCLMGLHTLQVDGQRAEKNWTVSTGLTPKTFSGRRHYSNHSYQPPQLDVGPNDPETAYTRGVFSTTVIPLCYILAMVVGIPSNAYILAFLRVRSSSLSTAVLYMSLASSDLLLLLSLSLRVHYHLNRNHWVFGETACRVVTAVFYGNVYCSANAIACLSLKRCLAVMRPFLYRTLPKTALALGVCLGTWVMFGAAVLPELLVRQTYQVPMLGITTCHDVLPLEDPSHALLVPYRLVLICVGYILPFLICICAHVGVVYHLGRSGSSWRPFIKVSTLVLVIFVVCFSPSGALHFAHYVRLFTSGDDRLYGYYSVAVCLCCFHSCLDPFLCLLMSKTSASNLIFAPTGTPRRPAVMI